MKVIHHPSHNFLPLGDINAVLNNSITSKKSGDNGRSKKNGSPSKKKSGKFEEEEEEAHASGKFNCDCAICYE